MELLERQRRYRAIEEYRQRPLIVYATSTRTVATPQGFNVGGSMQSDTVREFIDQVDAIPLDQKTVDILVHIGERLLLTHMKDKEDKPLRLSVLATDTDLEETPARRLAG
jgi:hypothetical protein